MTHIVALHTHLDHDSGVRRKKVEVVVARSSIGQRLELESSRGKTKAIKRGEAIVGGCVGERWSEAKK